MTKLPLIAVASLIAITGLAAPALAASPTPAGGVPFCSTTDTTLEAQKDMLSSQLRLSTNPGASVDVWNGCLKVTSTDNGKTTIAFYDPDSLRLIAEV